MPERQGIVFVDDEEAMRHAVGQWLGVAGYAVTTFASGAEALGRIGPGFDGVLITDLRMPGMDGMALLARALEADPDIPVILMTGQGDIESAVTAMRIGAYDFIEKPFAPDRFAQAVHRACEKRRLVLENRRLQNPAHPDALANRILGTSRAVERLRQAIVEIAATDVGVLVYGETGAGKDLVARCLHDIGKRGGGNYVALNCAAIPEAMAESELFGHEAGAFTGALGRRAGKLEHASGGTLLLDEVESMPLSTQAKLLRALQERAIERLGSNALVPVDLRVVAAAKTDLRAASEAGAFRADLYYRLSVVELHVPALRERREDIPLLFAHFAARAAEAHGRDFRPPRQALLDTLADHDWPGNVRELRNAAERHALGLGLGALAPPFAPEEEAPLARQLEAFEKRVIERALADTGGRIADVIDRLGVPRRTLNEKMARLGITRPGARAENER